MNKSFVTDKVAWSGVSCVIVGLFGLIGLLAAAAPVEAAVVLARGTTGVIGMVVVVVSAGDTALGMGLAIGNNLTDFKDDSAGTDILPVLPRLPPSAPVAAIIGLPAPMPTPLIPPNAGILKPPPKPLPKPVIAGNGGRLTIIDLVELTNSSSIGTLPVLIDAPGILLNKGGETEPKDLERSFMAFLISFVYASTSA